jgi:hypothetical protein
MNKTTVAEKACLALTSSSLAAKAKGEFSLVPNQESVAVIDDVTSLITKVLVVLKNMKQFNHLKS